MNLSLKRNRFELYGVFGTLTDESGEQVAVTLEHSYNNVPKIPPGTYKCVRGEHRLASMFTPFETFEITGVPGHTNILFHKGNTNNDSEGCVLLGSEVGTFSIFESKLAFDKFMSLQTGLNEFILIVS